MKKRAKTPKNNPIYKYVVSITSLVLFLMIFTAILSSINIKNKDVNEKNISVVNLKPQNIKPIIAVQKLEKTKVIPIKEKKSKFIKNMLPITLKKNEEILKKRNQVFVLERKLKTNSMTVLDADILKRLFREYKIKNNNIKELKERVDIIPISLTLAQGAIESGWGTSRFAQEGNAYFGQKVIGIKSDGIKPAEVTNPKIKVRKFDSLDSSVEAYYTNLNTHKAYKNFRKIRREQRSFGNVLTGDELSKTLVNYSELKNEYIAKIQSVIRTNNLDKYDYLEYQSVKKN